MRTPDRTEERPQGRGTLTIDTWFEIEVEPWDGCEPLPEGAEVFCVLVRATGAGGWTGYASCGQVAVMPGDGYADEVARQCADEAIANLEIELDRAAAGFGVEDARRRREDARRAQAVLGWSRGRKAVRGAR